MEWLEFLRGRNIPYSDKGANVSAGNVVVQCPFCGLADKGMHMSISVQNRGWFCWRCQAKGKDPVRLIMHLTGMPYEAAKSYRSKNTTAVTSDVLAYVTDRMNPSKLIEKREPLVIPPEFKFFNPEKMLFKPFEKYLRKRGFTRLVALSQKYGLRYCTRGAFEGRIIFPVYHEGQLVSWTGRTIYPGVQPRYKTLSADPQKAEKDGYPCAWGPINNYLLGYDDLLYSSASIVYLVEGPFDWLKIMWLLLTSGRRLNFTATCYFTIKPSDIQLAMLHEIINRCGRAIIIPDHGAEHQARKTRELLHCFTANYKRFKKKLSVATLPELIGDPGEFRNLRQLADL